ncbi:hypothetical protein CCP2SC5_1400006 [Azospirillaceae bacterium]
MALKDILVVVDDTPAAVARIDAAAALAARCDAHLVGLYVIVPLVLPAYVESQLPEELREAQRIVAEEKALRASVLFNERIDRVGRLARSEWRMARGDPTEVVAIQGRYSDLVIVGQIDPDFEAESPLVRAADLVFECGRPLLIIPYIGQFPVIGERILIGWNASREAARAVADARPLLVKARGGTGLCVKPRGGGYGLGDAPEPTLRGIWRIITFAPLPSTFMTATRRSAIFC